MLLTIITTMLMMATMMIMATMIMMYRAADDNDEDDNDDDVQGDLLLVMVDPDAPSPDSCPDKYWLHWLARVKVKVGHSCCCRS